MIRLYKPGELQVTTPAGQVIDVERVSVSVGKMRVYGKTGDQNYVLECGLEQDEARRFCLSDNDNPMVFIKQLESGSKPYTCRKVM